MHKKTHAFKQLTHSPQTHTCTVHSAFDSSAIVKSAPRKEKFFCAFCVAAKSCVFFSRTKALEVRAGRQCADPKKLRKMNSRVFVRVPICVRIETIAICFKIYCFFEI